MVNNIIKQLQNISRSRLYWSIYIAGSIALLLAALFYQYVLELPPCVVCIHVRMWLSLLLIISVIGLFLRNKRVINTLANLSILLVAVGLLERSYLLLGTERGFIFSDCGFDTGLPAWLALEDWLPWLYRVETTCGYTPEIVFGITMAETLLVLSVLLILISFSVFMASFLPAKNENPEQNKN